MCGPCGKSFPLVPCQDLDLHFLPPLYFKLIETTNLINFFWSIGGTATGTGSTSCMSLLLDYIIIHAHHIKSASCHDLDIVIWIFQDQNSCSCGCIWYIQVTLHNQKTALNNKQFNNLQLSTLYKMCKSTFVDIYHTVKD